MITCSGRWVPVRLHDCGAHSCMLCGQISTSSHASHAAVATCRWQPDLVLRHRVAVLPSGMRVQGRWEPSCVTPVPMQPHRSDRASGGAVSS
jgi:hypothetical protein